MNNQEKADTQDQAGRVLKFKLHGIEDKLQIRYLPETAYAGLRDMSSRSHLFYDEVSREYLLSEWLASCIVWWNRGSDEEPLPITPDNIRELTHSVLITISDAIAKDLEKKHTL